MAVGVVEVPEIVDIEDDQAAGFQSAVLIGVQGFDYLAVVGPSIVDIGQGVPQADGPEIFYFLEHLVTLPVEILIVALIADEPLAGVFLLGGQVFHV